MFLVDRFVMLYPLQIYFLLHLFASRVFCEEVSPETVAGMPLQSEWEWTLGYKELGQVLGPGQDILRIWLEHPLPALFLYKIVAQLQYLGSTTLE